MRKGRWEGMRSGGSLFEEREEGRGGESGNELQHWPNFSRFSHSAQIFKGKRKRERERGTHDEMVMERRSSDSTKLIASEGLRLTCACVLRVLRARGGKLGAMNAGSH